MSEKMNEKPSFVPDPDLCAEFNQLRLGELVFFNKGNWWMAINDKFGQVTVVKLRYCFYCGKKIEN
jgi:hypothetical protein